MAVSGILTRYKNKKVQHDDIFLSSRHNDLTIDINNCMTIAVNKKIWQVDIIFWQVDIMISQVNVFLKSRLFRQLCRLFRHYVNLSDNDVDLSDKDVDVSDLYVDLSDIMSTFQIILLLSVGINWARTRF